MNKKIVVLVVVLLQALFVHSQAGGGDCSSLEPICTDVGVSFTAQSGLFDASTINPGNNYDCLLSQPSPTWYYLEIATSGDILMNLNAPSDIDYIIWGPYNSLAEAEANCNSYGNVVDCSFSFTNDEYPQILGAATGQVYVMLVTNYANVVQNITLTQTGGTGSTDCSIVNPPPPPSANCPEYSSISSSPNEACGNQLYYLNVPNTACDGFVSFNVVGNYGSSYGYEITWEVVSNQSGNIVASGGPGTSGGSINTLVGPLDPSIEGTIFNLIVYDSWGDGFNGTGGIIQIESLSGTVLAEISGNFGSEANQYFTSNIEISSSTIDITTPSGVVSETMGSCQDFSVELTLENNNFCTPISLDLPWEISCDETGTIISSGTHNVMVYPQVPTQGSDVVSVVWNSGSCSWDVSANNDCDLLDLGTLFSISPDPNSLSPYCSNGTESFTVDYLGFAAGPNCCQTAGPLTPITYDTTINTLSFVATNAYAGINNAAYAVVPANGLGGNAQSVVININGSGYCCPNCSASPEPYYVDVYIDGIQVLFQGPLTNTSFSYSINEVDLSAYGVTYSQNSVIEVYVLPNNFWYGTPQIYTTFIPGASCTSLGAGQWTMGTLSTTINTVFEQQTATSVSCSYILDENYTCCSSVMSLPPDDLFFIECSDDIVVPTPPVINDNCGSPITPVMTENATPSCVGDKIYTYTYTDCSGATAVWTCTYTINDNTPPTASNPNPIVIGIGPAPAPDVNVIIDEVDNCTVNPVVAFVSDVSDGNLCPETITRTYSITDDCGNETLVTQTIEIGGSPVPDPVVIANGPICEGSDAIYTITGVVDAVVTYDTGLGSNTVTLTGGEAIVTVPSVAANTTITLTNISDGSCNSALNITATTIVNTPNTGTESYIGCVGDGYSVVVNGNIYDENTPTGTEVMTNSNGCDSTVTIDLVYNNNLTGTESYTGCVGDGYSVVVNGNIYDEANPAGIEVLSSSNGCDSTVTIDLVYNNNTLGTESYIGCVGDGYSVVVNGTTYDESNPTGIEIFTNSIGCDSTVTIDLVFNNSPLVGITNNSGSTELTCSILEISLTATGADSYNWDNGLGGSSDVTINSPGTYTVIGYSILGCQSTAQITITQDNMVDIIATLNEPEICSGEDAVINLASSNATSFNWTVIQNGASGASSGSGINAPGLEITQTLTATGTNPGTVEYTITPILGACIGAPQTIIVTVNPPVTPLFNALGPYCLDELTGDNLNNISTNNISGTWSPSTINTSVVGITTYSFTVNAGECAIGTTMDIVVNPLPTVSFSADNLEGCAPLNVSLESGNSTGNNIWTIGNGEVLNGASVNTLFTSSGCYDVTLVVEENGCSNTMTINDYICVQEDPIAQFTFSPETFTDVNEQVTFSNNSMGAVDYLWNFGDGATSNITNPTHLFAETEEGVIVSLTAISEFGCIHTVEHIIPYDEQEVFYVPNTFTPDGDNFNQIFSPIFYSGFDPFNFSMLIFNRWGELIFETKNAEIGWDGSYSDKAGVVADGIYTWKITYKNPQTDERKIIVGHVLVLR